MATQVLIYEGSNFAQKQLAQALPANWSIDVTLAKNGVEGLQAIKADKGEIVFLDLTMPNLDSYQALEQLHEDVELWTSTITRGRLPLRMPGSM